MAKACLYYITVMNEPYAMPAMRGDVKDGILRGMYRFRPAANAKAKPARTIVWKWAAILNEVLRAQEILESKYGVAADGVERDSYKELYNDGIESERWNRLHPGEKARVPYVTKCLADAPGRAGPRLSDYLKTLPI